MEYLPLLNLLLEALAYLGRRAAGNTIQRLTERLQSNGVTDLARFRQRLAPIETLMNELDRQLPIPEEELQSLFGNLAGFPYNTIGSCCPAFLLFYPMTAHFSGNLAQTVAELQKMSPERLAGSLAVSLDIADEAQAGGTMSAGVFSERVLSLSVPAESKVAILDLYHRPEPVLQRASHYLEKAIRLLHQKQEAMEAICATFTDALRQEGPGAIFVPYLQLNLPPGASIRSPALSVRYGHQSVGDALGGRQSGAGVLRHSPGAAASHAGLQSGPDVRGISRHQAFGRPDPV